MIWLYNESMSIILQNKTIQLVIETAGEKYRGSRFDWNGTVVQIKYNGKTLLSQEKKIFHRNDRIYGRGLHNEFGIKNCIGYDEIPEGDYFPKIGTGWLKKDSKPYFFYTKYEMQPLSFSFEKISETKAIFTCISGEKNGWSYTYTKTIELSDNSFVISYDIKNTGSKELSTTEYIHNFLLPGNHTTGADYELTYPWKFNTRKLAENVNSSSLTIEDDGVKFNSCPKGEFFLGGVWQAKTEDTKDIPGEWTLFDYKDGLKISEKDSFVPVASDLWGHSKDISPEIFTAFKVESGKNVNWKRTYSIENI